MTTTLTLLRTPASAIWAILVLATATSWALGTDHGITNHVHAGLAILLIAFVKVRLVGLYFMELRDAPLALRGIFEAYCLLVGATLIILYLLG